jgi:hypothetical protein
VSTGAQTGLEFHQLGKDGFCENRKPVSESFSITFPKGSVKAQSNPEDISERQRSRSFQSLARLGYKLDRSLAIGPRL